MKTKFFFCPICGNVVMKVVDSGVVPVCCGKSMVELEANGIEGFFDHHLPTIKKVPGGTMIVEIGEKPHPSTDEHHIVFIWMEIEDGGQFRYVKPGAPARAIFLAPASPVKAIYAYCNVHGLWKTELGDDEDRRRIDCSNSCETPSCE